MTLLTATALPLLVALTQIGLSTGHMLPENAAALVGAGVLSVMVYPGLALALNRRAAQVGTGDSGTAVTAAGSGRPRRARACSPGSRAQGTSVRK